MLTTAAVAFLVSLGTTTLKWVDSRLGGHAVHAVVFVLALVGAVYLQYHSLFPTWDGYLKNVLVLFSGAVALYQVLLSNFGFFQGPDKPVIHS